MKPFIPHIEAMNTNNMKVRICALLFAVVASVGLMSAAVQGALPGQFSVSATKKVYFSQGNLQYQASTKTWRFAANQYTRIGVNGNSNISDTYTGWIDWFGWGTGSTPTMTTRTDSKYSSFTDWGVNKISNGANQANLWRTLTQTEWEYLFSGRANATSRRSMATVNDVHGYIFLPDSWTLPNGLSFTADVQNSWTTNTYTSEQWQKMEQNGAVFLPKTASIYTSSGSEPDYYYESGWYSDEDGQYWSSTQSSTSSKAYGLSFYINGYYSQHGVSVTDMTKHCRRGVRLVIDSDKNISYTITWNNYDGTTLTTSQVAYGSTPAYTGSTPTKQATAEYTYTFNGWTPTIVAATANKTYTATYTATPRTYNITWKQDDGTTIDQETVAYGETPEHAIPTKSATEQYNYSFAGWTPEVVAVTGDATYTAVYNSVSKDLSNVAADQFAFVSHQNGSTIGLAKLSSHQTLEYSTDGVNWSGLTTAATIALNNGCSLFIRGKLTGNNSLEDYTKFAITGSVELTGNLNYIWNYENLDAPLKEWCGADLFQGCKGLLRAGDLTLPSNSLTSECYHGMFWGCSALETAPSLPATELAYHCYCSMFRECTSLVNAPSLPATALAENCYVSMFTGCTALKNAPELPATILADYCYYSMFSNCSSLTEAPELPAISLADYCYNAMFYGCSNLIETPMLPALAMKNHCYSRMFCHCVSLEAAPELPSMELADSCYLQMFMGCLNLVSIPTILPATSLADGCYLSMFNKCQSITDAPSLPATSLKTNCYRAMFYQCSALKTAPVLPAPVLADSCYRQMFYGCSELNYIKCMATDISASTCTNIWVSGVASSGTFVKHADMNSWTTGKNGIPSGWTTSSVTPYTISFDANGGIIPADGNMGNTPAQHITYLSGDQKTGYIVVYAGNTAFNKMGGDCPTREGYSFLGWYTAKTGGTKVYDNAGNRVIGTYWDSNNKWIGTTDLQLYAQWSVNSYTITFVDADGTTVLGQQSVEYGSAATAPNVEIPACHSLSWNKDFSHITGDLTVQAIWSDLPLASGTCGAQGDNLTWELSCDSVLTISGTGAMASYANIGQLWRNYMKSFKSVVIGHGVTSVGDSAFYNCSRLTSIEISSSVTSIGLRAFYKCGSLTSVTIPSSVTSIGVGAFCGCYGLTSMSVDAGNTVFDSRNNCNAIIETATDSLIVGCQNTVIPSSVTSVGNFAFRECSTLTSINIPNSVTSIGYYAFYACSGLTSVTIGNSVTSIGGGAFWNCSGLTSIDIPSSVTSIGRWAFRNCSGLTSVTIPSSVTGIGDYAFENCSGLTSVNLPNSITSMGLGAFCNCSGLTSVDIPNSITSLGDSTFYHCSGLITATIPSGVTSIGIRAFYKCFNLASLTIPNSVTSIGVGAFCDCSSLTSMSVDAGNTVYDSRNNCNAIIETATNTLVAGCQNTVIPNSVTSIGNFAFRECNTLTSIDIPGSVTSIGNGAFYGCTGLTTVTIPSGVASIAGWAFYDCRGLTSISCAATNVPELGSNMFNYVNKSIPLLVPAESIESYRAADQWKDFTNILPICPGSGTCGAEGDNLTWELSCDSVLTISGTGAMASLANMDPLWRAYMGNFKSVVIGNGITSIGDSAFYNCSHLTSVTIPSGITSIGIRAFYKCHNLTSVTIPNSVTSIGIGAFADGSSLTAITVEAGNTVYDSRENCNAIIETATNTLIVGCQNTVIPSSVTSIGDNAFRECSSLTSIDIPNSVTSIGNYTFRACTGLTSVTIGNGVTSIGKYAFYGCSGLTSLIIPYGVTDIGEGAFSYGSGLTSVIIPNSVTSIGDGAFYYCSGLTSVTIPSRVTGIGEYALGGCIGLTSITCKATNVPELGDNVFYLVDKSIPLHVPAESVDAYKAADQWKDFTNILSTCLIASGTCGAEGDNLTWELGCDGILTISGTGAMADYDLESLLWMDDYYRFRIQRIIIGNNVTSIGKYAFYATSVTEVTIPNSVTSIGEEAFSHCASLTGVTIPNSVRTIGNGAFMACSSMTSVSLGSSVTSVGEYAFAGCGLISLAIPSSVTNIGENAFNGCYNLANITVDEENSHYDSRENCNALIETSSNTLLAGSSNTLIPNSVTSIANEAFSYRFGLTSIAIPNSVTSIGSSAFSDCSGLTSVTIGNSVTGLGNYAFAWCYALASVTCEAIIPPVCGNSTYSEVEKSIPVYVPCTSVDAYKAANGWKDFTNILPIDTITLTYSITSPSIAQGSVAITDEQVYCDRTELTVRATAADGYEFTQWSDGNTDNPRTLTLTRDSNIVAMFEEEYIAPVIPSEPTSSSVPENVLSSGRDFWLTYMYNFGKDDDNIELEIYVVAMRSDARVTITTGEGTVLASNVAVSASTAYTLTIPSSMRSKVYNTGSDVKQSTGVHIQATSEVAVYFRNGYSNEWDYSYDKSPAIATNALGKEYMIQTYYRDMMNNEFAIVGTSDGTTVEITLSTEALKPSESSTDLYASGTVLTRTLNAGEVIQIKGARYNSTGRGDLSGTTIKASKPIAVFNGGAKASVPLNTGFNGDHIVEPAIPISAWGKRFVAMEMSGFPERKSMDDGGLVESSSPTQYVLTALYDGTEVKVDGSTICTLNSGQNIPYEKISSMFYSKIRVGYDETPKLVETSNPVMLYAYMTSGAMNSYDYDVLSEPALALIPDVNKGVNISYFYCAPSPSSIHYANVVVQASGVNDMKLNGVDVSDQFTTLSNTFIGYSENYAYARLSLSSGVNILTNSSTKFVAVTYSTELYFAIAEACATVFNLAPTAPVVYIDDNPIQHNSIMEYCNRAPGIPFSAVVDYPHDSVRWYLGEGATSTELTAEHMYGKTIGGADTTHNVRFYVYHHSPISGIKYIDSVCVALRIHSMYNDTLVVEATNSYTWEGETYYESGDYTKNLTSVVNGCDSVLTLRLVIHEGEIIVSDEQDIADLAVGAGTDITVTATGHLSVSKATAAHSLTMEYGLNSHAQVTGVENLSVESAAMIMDIESARKWFAFGVPFEVSVASGIMVEGASKAARPGYDFVIDEYDGAHRASMQDGWTRLSSTATLQPGNLYMLYAASATTWRLTAADASALTETSAVAVAAYPSATGDHHAGWNGIANSRWSNAEAALEDVNFASLYDNAYGVYRVEPLGTYIFAAAEPFFVQAVADDVITFDRSAASAPWRVAQDRPSICTLTLCDEAQTFTDKAYLTVSPEKDNRYTVGCDLEKMQVAAPAVPQLWIEAYSMRLAAHAVPSGGEARILPIGMYAPVAGTYVMAMQELPEALSVSLTKDGQPVWNISESAALVPLNAGDNGGYALYIRRLPEVVTGLPAVATGTEVQKIIMDDKLYIIRDGKVYTVTGARVQ